MRKIFIIIVAAMIAAGRSYPVTQVEVGNVRVQLLSPRLVRIEERGRLGFEDRKTFLVVEREWPEMNYVRGRGGGASMIRTQFYEVRIPSAGRSLVGVEVRSLDGKVLFKFDGNLSGDFRFLAPGEMSAAFAVADSPRVVPPWWGATPAPDGTLGRGSPLAGTSGWDLRNDAPDIYVFVRGKSSYTEMRGEYLRLTGSIPLPPLFVLGFWDSRYYAYTEESALEVIDHYRSEKIPLDVFVVDTDWRVNASDGYEINKQLFPDMRRFLREAHARSVRIMFNDHPVARARGLNPVEIRYRWEGLTGLLGIGMDFWWYDKNWPKIMEGPVEGIDREVWGQRVYYDVHTRYRRGERPLLMSMRSSHPASHRYPIWWTGDIHSTYKALEQGVADSVNDGIALMPWVSQDLGGHTGKPSAELYVRFLQWGCLSPVARVHCTKTRIRYPWAFGEGPQRIVTEYIRLRYRLLPMLYSAARRAYDDGTPLLRRCDLEWPEYEQARSDRQYLLGDDILVSPIVRDMRVETIASKFLRSPNGKRGLRGEYFANKSMQGRPALVRLDPTVDFKWNRSAPDKRVPRDEFSVRWMGRLGPVPATGEYKFLTYYDDGVRLWLDGRKIIDDWTLNSPTTSEANVRLEKGKSYDLRLEYFENTGGAVCGLSWSTPGGDPRYAVWIPPGVWEDAWTGELVRGPQTLEVAAPLWFTPIYVRRGSIILLAPQMYHTSEKLWDPVTIEAYPPESGMVTRQLYEDDGRSLAYQQGSSTRTWISLSRRKPKLIELAIGPAKGAFPGQLDKRAWVVRFHLKPGENPAGVWVDSKRIALDSTEMPSRKPPHARTVLAADSPARGTPLPMPFRGAGARPGHRGGVIVEIHLNSSNTKKPRHISLLLN